MLPKNLQYGSKVNSAPARSLRSNIQPANGTSGYNLGDTITIPIPTRANLVMVPTENYLKFDLSVTNGSGADASYRWDSCGAHGLIQRIRVYHGSNLLEDIDNYGLLAKMLMDLQVPTDASYGKLNVLAGTRNDLVVKSNSVIGGGADATNLYNAINRGTISANQVNSGELLGSVNAPIPNNGSTTNRTYCLNLVSIVGSLCQNQYFPLFACTSGNLRVDITLVDSMNKAMLCTSSLTALNNNPATRVNISNIEYVANFIELGDAAMTMINASLGNQPLQFVVPQYKNFGNSSTRLTIASTEVTFSIPAKYSSLKSLFVTCRETSGTDNRYPYSSVNRGIQQYYFRVGPNIFPSKAPSTNTEMFAEVMKAIGSMSDLDHQPSIERVSYTMQASDIPNIALDPIYNNVQSGSFYVGLDLENYASAPKDTIFTGYNSNTDDIYFVGSFAAQAVGQEITPRFDAFAMFDCVYLFENNTCFIRF